MTNLHLLLLKYMFKQATLSTSYTLIMANFKDCGTLLLQSLFLLSVAFVVVGHCFHILSSIIENDFENIFKWSHLAQHCAQCLADDQSQLLSTNAASMTEQTVGKMSRSCLTEQTPHSVSKQATIPTELIFEFVMKLSDTFLPFSVLWFCYLATHWHEHCQCAFAALEQLLCCLLANSHP